MLIYITLSIFLLSIFYNFVFAPLFKKYNFINQKIKILEVRLYKYQILIQNREKINQIYKNFPSILTSNAPNEKKVVSVLGEIERLAKLNNLNLLNMKPHDFNSEKEIILEIRLEGDIKNIFKFIYDLENSFYLLHIKQLFLTKSNSKENNLECSLIIRQVSLLNPNQ